MVNPKIHGTAEAMELIADLRKQLAEREELLTIISKNSDGWVDRCVSLTRQLREANEVIEKCALWEVTCDGIRDRSRPGLEKLVEDTRQIARSYYQRHPPGIDL